jgi:hypothetical protein
MVQDSPTGNAVFRRPDEEEGCPKGRIGILTFHRCINYGSYWQARCLVEGLRAHRYDAWILDHTSPAVDFAEWRVALRPTLPTPVPKEDIAAYVRKTRKFQREFERLPLSRSFSLDDLSRMEKFDTVVLGSDEVWNLQHPWFAEQPAFFGVGLRAERVIAYAASFGNYSCWKGIGSPWTDFLGQLDAISVRDENSWWMIKNSLGVEPEMVLDPCLQFPLPPEGEWEGLDKPYALVYGHNFSPAFAARVREWADERGLPLVSIGYRNDWADHQWLDAGPHDFAHAMRRAQAVTTNFFHGCVFALQNEKPFACELTPYRSIKVSGLLELLDASHHLVEGNAALDALLGQPAKAVVYERIAEVRLRSNEFLKRSLLQRHASQTA